MPSVKMDDDFVYRFLSLDSKKEDSKKEYFRKKSNTSKYPLTQSGYKYIADKIDISNPEHGGSVETALRLLVKKNPDIEKTAEFQNIRNGINREIFAMGSEYNDHLKKSLAGSSEKIKEEMFDLVKKFYSSGYKIIAYDIMNKLSTLSEWIDDALSTSDKNKHKIKEIFNLDSDFHKSFTYLNQIKDLLEKPELEKELAAFSTTIYEREKGKVPDIRSCVDKADANKAARQLFSLLSAKKGRVTSYLSGTSYVLNANVGRNCDDLEKKQNPLKSISNTPLESISNTKDAFILVDKECNIVREANGKVGIFDLENNNAIQTYQKDKQKRFNDFKTIVLQIFENGENYDIDAQGGGVALVTKQKDFFFKNNIPKNIAELKKWAEFCGVSNTVNLFKIIATEGGKKGRDYNACVRIADAIGLDKLTDKLNRQLRNIKDLDAEGVSLYLESFIDKLNAKLADYDIDIDFMRRDQGKYFLQNHQGLKDIKKILLQITGGRSVGFVCPTKDPNDGNIMRISGSMKAWLEEQKNDLVEDKKFIEDIADGGGYSLKNLVNKLNPKEIEGMKTHAHRILQKNIRNNQFTKQAKLDAQRERWLFEARYKNDNRGAYYPEWGYVWPYQQNPYNQWNHPYQQSLPLQQNHIRQILDELKKDVFVARRPRGRSRSVDLRH